MPAVPIADLWPGQPALGAKPIADYLARLVANEPLPPIDLIRLNGRLIVRGGHHRVRAFIQHNRGAGALMPDIEINPIWEPSPREAPSGFRKLKEGCADYFGKGAAGFLRMPICQESTEDAFLDLWYSSRESIVRYANKNKSPN